MTVTLDGAGVSTRDYTGAGDRRPVQGRFSDSWAKLSAFLVAGYLCAGRAFAYLGLPPLNLYIGELSLGAFLAIGPRIRTGPWLQVIRRIRRLRRLEWLLLLSLCYGGFEALRGIFAGYPALTALRDTCFNYYPLFLFLGIWIGLRDKNYLPRVIRVVAWINGCYGMAWVLFLGRLAWVMPFSEAAATKVPLFSGPYGASAVALLGLLTFEPKLRRVWHLILLNLLVLLGGQVRAEWVGLAAGVVVFAWLTKKFKHLAIAVSAALVLLGLMYVTQVSLRSPNGGKTGGTVVRRISTDDLLARALAPMDKNAAEQLAPKSDVSFAASTAEWRLVWWAAIWAKVNGRPSTALLGFGYGYPVGTLNPQIKPGTFIQTPHNAFFYALAFSGWLGAALFALLQFEIARLLWRSYRTSGLAFGPVCWVALLTMSLFEDFFEAPFGAIPFFLLLGAAIAPALLAQRGGDTQGKERAPNKRAGNAALTSRPDREAFPRGVIR